MNKDGAGISSFILKVFLKESKNISEKWNSLGLILKITAILLLIEFFLGLFIFAGNKKIEYNVDSIFLSKSKTKSIFSFLNSLTFLKNPS